jgi:GxxExxY protein
VSGLLLSDLTEKIIAAAIDVHRALGPGYLESVYENALAHELKKRGHKVMSQVVFQVQYDGIIVGEHRCDLLVDDLVILELKATEQVAKAHKAQLISTLKAANRPVGLLLNFGLPTLAQGIERIIFTK